jgi:hypothetical protein
LKSPSSCRLIIMMTWTCTNTTCNHCTLGLSYCTGSHQPTGACSVPAWQLCHAQQAGLHLAMKPSTRLFLVWRSSTQAL